MGLDPHLYLYDLQTMFPVDHEHAQQNMSIPAFISYLYKHSPWIEWIFTYEIPLTGSTLDEDHSFGEGEDEVFSRGDLEKFHEELRNVPRPSDEDTLLAWNYDHLMRLITVALSKPHLVLTRANL
jgi:hypothetical protein